MGRLGQRFLLPRYLRFLHNVIRDEVLVEDPECSLKILGRLRSGGIVDMHLDVSFSEHLIEWPFAGRQRLLPAGPLHMARVAGCAVLPILVIGHARALDIRIGPPLTLDRSLTPDAFCAAHLPGLASILESYVLAHPGDWELWIKL